MFRKISSLWSLVLSLLDNFARPSTLANPVPRKKLCLRPHEARALSRELPFTAVRRLTLTLTADSAQILPRLTFANSSEQISPRWNMTGVERTCNVTRQIANHHMWVAGKVHHQSYTTATTMWRK